MEQQLQKLTQAILARGKLLKQLEVQCTAIQASVEEMKPKPVTPPAQASSSTPPAQASSSRSLATGELDAPMLTGCSMNCPDDDTDSRTSAFMPDAASGPPSTAALLDAAITNPEPTDATILVRDGTSDLTPTPSGTAVHPIYLGDEHVLNPSNCQLGVRKVFDIMCGTDGVSYGFSTNGLVLTTCCLDESSTADIAVVDRANRRRERAHHVLILARLENSCGAMELRQPWPPPTQVDVACSGVELCPISWLSCEDYRGGVKWMPPWSPPVPGRMLILEKGFCPAINSTEVMCSFLPFDHVRMVSEGYQMCDEVILRAQTRGVLNIFYGCDSDVNILEGNRSSSKQSLGISWSLCDFRGFSEFGKWVMVGLVSSEQGVEAMGPFHLVISFGIGFEVVSLSRFFIACAEVKGYFQGLQVHCLTIKSGFPVDICVKNAILDRYRKYKALAEGYLIFQDMERIDAVSWNAIIAGFSMGKLSEFALKQARPQMELFCKTLTASDTNTHGGFSVPRRSAEKILPSLDFSMQPTAQELQARDIHDNVWTFRHIYRGVDCKTKASDNKPRALSKIASLQQFIPHDYDASDHGTASFPVSAIHRIGILDIRIFNTDRHAGNLLVRKLDTGPGRFEAQTELIPINHGLCLPESLEDPYFEWIHWPQASIPFNEEEIEYIANLDPIKDVEMLRMELPMIHEASLRVLKCWKILILQQKRGGLLTSTLGKCSLLCAYKLKAQADGLCAWGFQRTGDPLLNTHSDPSNAVVLLVLEVHACIAKESHHFHHLVSYLIHTFHNNHVLLEKCSALIVRRLCVLLGAEKVYREFYTILESEGDLAFASTMVQALNLILLTSTELAELRSRLKKSLVDSCGKDLFLSLYASWCHSLMATTSLCLLAQAYSRAISVIQSLGEDDINFMSLEGDGHLRLNLQNFMDGMVSQGSIWMML